MPLVLNIRSYSLFAVPKDVKDKNMAAAILSEILDLDREFIFKRISSKKHFVWLKRKLSDKVYKQLLDLKIDGLFFIKENKRSYPNQELASHVLGFANIDNVGLEGIELTCNKYLEGEPGYAFFVRDARQSALRLENSDRQPIDGYDVVLTIDQVIQYIAEKALEEAFKKHKAKGMSIVVMDPNTGEILALANQPTFNPNNPQGSPIDARRNRAICDYFEPGSVFKIIAASAALEENKFKEEDKIFCENGEYRVANHTLHDHHPHGWLTFSEVIQQSSNIGVTKIAQRLGLAKINEYAKLFGFGELTGIKLQGEVKGVLKPLGAYSKTSIGAVPIGQEVTVTALQLACAMSAVANGGLFVKPYIIKKVKDKYDEPIQEFKPQHTRKAISPETSQRLKDILALAVENGTGKMAMSKDYRFAGKTGTAQKINPSGGYSHSIFYASFIGFAPVENPRLVIVVVADEPHPYYFGGVVSAPVFKEVAEKSLKYLEIEEKIDSLRLTEINETEISN